MAACPTTNLQPLDLPQDRQPPPLRRIAWLKFALAAALLVGLPVAGNAWRRGGATRCAVDGVDVNPLFAAEIVDAAGTRHRFCCIQCADYWTNRQSAAPRQIRVADEVSGHWIDARDAWFVRSLVVTDPATGNQLHAFHYESDALKHATAAQGVVLKGNERPFSPHSAQRNQMAGVPGMSTR